MCIHIITRGPSGQLPSSASIPRSLHRHIDGDAPAILKVKIPGLPVETRKLIGKTTALLAGHSPPDLILNRHCSECEFQTRCRQKALEKDDLSLLSNIKAKERKKFNSEGIFTINQLSFTFRPRRRPKRLRDKHAKYHHALKALAIREKKIHVVGEPELKFEGTVVYLDVEGIPDRDFYYLIGARVKTPEGYLNQSFWADNPEDEKTRWMDFIGFIAGIAKPCFIRYGSFESQFLKRMVSRYGEYSKEIIDHSVNVL